MAPFVILFPRSIFHHSRLNLQSICHCNVTLLITAPKPREQKPSVLLPPALTGFGLTDAELFFRSAGSVWYGTRVFTFEMEMWENKRPIEKLVTSSLVFLLHVSLNSAKYSCLCSTPAFGDRVKTLQNSHTLIIFEFLKKRRRLLNMPESHC